MTLILNSIVPKAVIFAKELFGCLKRSKCLAAKKKTQLVRLCALARLPAGGTTRYICAQSKRT